MLFRSGGITGIANVPLEQRQEEYPEMFRVVGELKVPYILHKNCVLAKLAGIHDINEAMKLKNKVVFIDREDAELEEGAFFLADLMGLEVRDADSGEVLGQIADILTPPASNVYVVTGGKQDHMIPAVPEFIVETNIDEGYLRVRLIEGM